LSTVEGTPVLYGDSRVVRQGKTLIVYADILASAYFLLTRYEEWVRRDVRDEYGRFPGRESLPYRAGFIDRPVVEEYAELLRRWVGEAGVDLPRPNRHFSVLLTHDVDSLGISLNPLRPLVYAARAILGQQSWKQAWNASSVALGWERDSVDNLDDVVALDRGLTDGRNPNRSHSIYFFLAGGRTRFDGDYSIRSRKTRRAIRTVAASGASVGLHASYEADGQPALLLSERRALERAAGMAIEKNRHHFLRWRETTDGVKIATAGITWDSTLGYADVAGFRLGVCHPIPLYDLENNRPLGIEEHPLIAMDVTLSNPSYMNLDEQTAFDYVCRLARTVWRYHGELVLLWHNYALDACYDGYHRRLYPRILDEMARLLDSHDSACTKEGAACG
jgi:hypothetical protein